MTASTYQSQHGKKTMRRTPHQIMNDRIDENAAEYRRLQQQTQKAPEPPPVQVVHTTETVYVGPSLDELALAALAVKLLL